MTKPVILDLFCGAGGAAMGYASAGFDVVGVDIEPQPRYPFEFHQGNALKWVEMMYALDNSPSFDAIHASPPCQAYTNAQRLRGNDHPDLIEPVRALLNQTGLPYVIENVPGAPLLNPVTLCGARFGLKTYRHRLFETNWYLPDPGHWTHIAPQAKMGRRPRSGEYIQVVGHFSDVKFARKAMEIHWMTRDELAEAIPPAYTQYVGDALITHLEDKNDRLQLRERVLSLRDAGDGQRG